MNWGGFNFQSFYEAMVNYFTEGIFVEIGTWEGDSTAFMAEKIKESGKNIKFYTIDTFEPYYHTFKKETVQADYEKYLNNIEQVWEYIITLKGDSCEMASRFDDGSVSFIFIDGDHRYEKIKQDILTWLPKLKPDGIIAGHDYGWNYPGVVKAVDEIFDHKVINHDIWVAIR